VEKMKLEDLKPAEYNPRRISDEAFDGLGESISQFGMLSHIVWNKRTGNIVGGHQRYRQLIKMGEVETDVVVVDLDDNEEVALNITLNNKMVRGDFTKDVIGILRETEARLGSAFQKIGLLDLFEHLRSRGFDKEPKKKKTTTTSEPKKSTPSSSSINDAEEPPKSDGKPQAMITCPKCRSQWKLTDNEVVFNGVLNRGSQIGAK
jgi:hypothetical protein